MKHASTSCAAGLGAVLVLTMTIACGGDESPTAPSNPNVPFTITDLTEGTGAEANTGDIVSVAYTGWLWDETAPENKGTVFDSSSAANPFVFQLGVGAVIPGWDQGIPGMKVGGTRRLDIPPELAYGAEGIPGVTPPNAALVFEVELLAVS